MFGHDLSNFKQLQHDVNVIFGGKKTIDAKIQQHCRPKVVGVQDGTKGSLAQVVEPMVESMIGPAMELVVEFMVEHVMEPVAQSQTKPMIVNHDNICVVNECSSVKNLDDGVPVE